MKKLNLFLIVVFFSLKLSANYDKSYIYKHLYYIEKTYTNPTFILKYDKKEIFININGFENKTIKFEKFSASKCKENKMISYSIGECEGETYEIKHIYDLSTKETHYQFINKNTGGTIEYHFG